MGPVPTGELILQKALDLFALKGFDAVSVQEKRLTWRLPMISQYRHESAGRIIASISISKRNAPWRPR